MTGPYFEPPVLPRVEVIHVQGADGCDVSVFLDGEPAPFDRFALYTVEATEGGTPDAWSAATDADVVGASPKVAEVLRATREAVATGSVHLVPRQKRKR